MRIKQGLALDPEQAQLVEATVFTPIKQVRKAINNCLRMKKKGIIGFTFEGDRLKIYLLQRDGQTACLNLCPRGSCATCEERKESCRDKEGVPSEANIIEFP